MRFLLAFFLALPLVAQQAAPPAAPPAKAEQAAPAEQAAKPAESATAAAADAKPAESPAPAPPAEQNISGSIDFGFRTLTGVGGNFQSYRNIVNLGEGPKLFGLDF